MKTAAEVVIVGSGFAGALLARLLAVQGRAVVLIERGRHPRFAIGESTTPLANLCLERLADHYGLPDLRDLAAHGRWLERLPDLRRGLKRGFTFYRQRPGMAYANGVENEARLLVAASPADRVADTHWLREDVDHHFVRRAQAAGVVYLDETRVTEIAFTGRGVRLRAECRGAIREVRAEMLIDATGPGGLLRRALPIRSRLARTATRSLLLYSHFSGVRPFADVAREAGASVSAEPYPEDRAAVHQVLDDGWMYALRFDHGVVSAGLLATPAGARRLSLTAGDAARSWDALLARYPSLAAQFRDARPLFPVRYAGRVQHRLAQAAGDRWALLPHTFAFVDPLFSTGIAWSLLAVERLADAFANNPRGASRSVPTAAALRRYEALLTAEADHIDRLVAGAYRALPDFSLFASHSMLYFAVASFAEARQRLVSGSGWDAFLGAGDPAVEKAFRESLRRLTRLTRGGRSAASHAQRGEFADWVARTIASRNVAGLADPAKHNLYPVDLDVLVARSHLLGLTPSDVRRALPRLRA